MINTFLKNYFAIGLVIFILNIVSIGIVNVFSYDDFVRYFKFKTILIDCYLIYCISYKLL